MNLSIYPCSLILLATLLAGCGGDATSPGTPEGGEPDDSHEYTIPAADLRLRDPFIFLDASAGIYYLHVNGGKKVSCYTSKDLQMWKKNADSFTPAADFWGKQDFWAPDMYEYNGKYYIFITVSSTTAKRGTTILVSRAPGGPYEPLVNRAATPADQLCLDGALHVDQQGNPWIIYCHEWLEAVDGEVCALKLTADLRGSVGDPVVLFRASSAPWVGNITSGEVTGKVTDAPFIYEQPTGRMIMLWSSFAKSGKYAIGQAFSDNGLAGPWTQATTPLNTDHGGHAMLFTDKAGQLRISYHAPNTAPNYLVLRNVSINGGALQFDE